MSDIWIKTTNTGPTRWRKATNIYIKRFNSGATRWFAAKVVWIKNTSASWLRVWPTSGVFAITDPYITTTSSGSTPLYGNQTVGTNDVIRIGTTYYGRNGTWDPNGFSISSYNYTWPYYSMQENQPGDFDILGNLGTGVYSAPSRALTISDPSDANSVDGKYISFRITANASNALYSNTADSKDSYGKIRAIRRTPINISFAINGPTSVGSVLSVGSSWNTTEARKPDAGRTTIKWYRSDSATAIYSGGGRTEIASGVYQYTLVQADSGKYIVAEETTFNTGSDYDIGVDQFVNGQNQVTAVSSIITAPYRFAFGNTLYVSSNGHIGLDSGWSGYSQMSPGRNIAIFVKDLEQYYLAEYSDNSSYYLYIKSYLYDTSASSLNALDYQIRFYNDSSINYCDVYVVRRGSNLGATSNFRPGYYSSGTTGHINGFNSISSGTGFRVFFGESAATTPLASWTGVPDSLWDVIQTWTYPGSGGDDTFTAVVSAPNQSAPFPTNVSLPTLTTDTGNFSAGSTITINPGSWSGTSSFNYELLYGNVTPVATDSTATKTLINTNQYVITNADATASSFYFRGRVTGYSGPGQTGNSAIALSTTSARSTLNPTTTISVGTSTSSGFTISGAASPLTGFGGSYVTVTAIEIFNQFFQSVATITTGLPAVNGSTGVWSYIWTGGSSSTTYYAKATVRATDSDQTTFTTGFSSSITTSAGVSIPTSLSTSINASNQIVVSFSGGSGDQYDIFYANSNSRPTDGQVTADFPNVTSPYTATTLTARGITRWFWVRTATGSLRSNWFPTAPTVVTARIPLFAPPTPVITNSAQSSASLSWHWTQPTPTSSQDEPTSWDYNISTSTFTPSSWTNLTTRPTSTSPLVTSGLSADTTYYLHVKAKNDDGSATTFQSGATTSAVTLYTVTFSANGATGSPSVTSVTQSTSGGSVTLATIGSMGGGTNRIFGGWRTGSSSGQVYGFGTSFTPTSNTTLFAYYGPQPTCSAPTLNFRRFPNNTSSSWEYFADYPTPSGAYTEIIGMQYEIYSANSVSGAKIAGGDGTLAYPTGGDLYPYLSSRDGTYWSFLVRSGEGGRAATTSSRFGRVRVRMRGIDGANYPGTFNSPLV
jgi:hypothetical protein